MYTGRSAKDIAKIRTLFPCSIFCCGGESACWLLSVTGLEVWTARKKPAGLRYPLIYQRASKEKIIIGLQKQILHIQEFLQYFQEKEQLQTGTTCSGLLIIRNQYYLFHIGDSRIYQFNKCGFWGKRYRGKPFYRIRQLTADDHDERGRLWKALGMAGTDRAVFQTGKVYGKTGFLICTDGFYQGNDMCLAAQMLGALLHREKKLLSVQMKRRLEQLGKTAWESGNRDDKAAICVLIK